jgi:hypothetical protein
MREAAARRANQVPGALRDDSVRELLKDAAAPLQRQPIGRNDITSGEDLAEAAQKLLRHQRKRPDRAARGHLVRRIATGKNATAP